MQKKNIIIVFFVYALLVFPSFYFVYKFADPIDIAHDFFQYYRLYNTWDWHNVNAPFNMRLISSFLVFLSGKAGIYYETASAFDKYTGFGFDKSVYFNALFVNYLAVVATSSTLFLITWQHRASILLAFTSGLVYILGFGTIFYELMPCTDAFSTLLFTVLMYFYLKKSKFVFALIVMLIFQREYILMALALITFIDLVVTRNKYYRHVLLAAVIAFGIYFVLRKTVFYTPALSFQVSGHSLITSLFATNFPFLTFVKQTILTLNIFLLYVFIISFKRHKKMRINLKALVKILLLLLQIVVISFAAALGNNTGRYFYMMSPFVIFYLAQECKPLFKTEVSQITG